MTIKLVSFLAKLFSAALLAIMLGASSPAMAADDLNILSLDELFDKLKTASSGARANEISGHIWRHWLTPEDPALLVLMNEARAAKTFANVSHTFALLEEMIEYFPTYAEAWNLRATLHYELGNYDLSLADIAETLAREPRHYGALSGRALVYLALGKKALARQSILEARRFHPFIAENPPFNDLIEPVVQI